LGDAAPQNYRKRSVKRLEKRFSLFVNKTLYNDIVYRSMRLEYYSGLVDFSRILKRVGKYYLGYGRRTRITSREAQLFGDYLTLIINYKFLTYDYLLNFTMSINQWYSFLSKSFGLVPINYYISKSFSSLLPIYRFEVVQTRFNDYMGDVQRIDQ